MSSATASDTDLREPVSPHLLAAMFGSSIQETIDVHSQEDLDISNQIPADLLTDEPDVYDAHVSSMGPGALTTAGEVLLDSWIQRDEPLVVDFHPTDLVVAPVPFSWIQQLDNLCSEATEENWDGEGALPVQHGAREKAIAFVRALPMGTPLPECSIDPDGEISLGWHGPNDYVFSVSVGRTGRLSYAGLFGNSDGYGTEWFTGTAPAEITVHLARLLSSAIADGQSD